MQPLNPFLKAFFKSALPAQCTPVQNHVLLVPTTEVFFTSHDSESGASYADLATSEEFLSSHVLRIPTHNVEAAAKESPNMRENRGKAKQYATINGRMVVVKDTYVYSSKGFKTHVQAQLLSDSLYFPDSLEPRPWLIYFISMPLIGTLKETRNVTANSSNVSQGWKFQPQPLITTGSEMLETCDGLPSKKSIQSFNELLNKFPLIARQMQPGLENLFKEFNMVFEKPLPPPPSATVIPDPLPSRKISAPVLIEIPVQKSRAYGDAEQLVVENIDIEIEEDTIRSALETAVTSAIDLFQMVDKHQLSLLGGTTDLTGPMVERMIEQYVAEQVHDKIFYPRLCSYKRVEDMKLQSLIRQMACVDISQVGIVIQGGQQGKYELTLRLGQAVGEFRKLCVARSPQKMMEILLVTLKTVTQLTEVTRQPENRDPSSSEKISPILTMNADALVSLLLIVVIRARVHYLQARLYYMRNFIFIDDVEGGEMGYALSTLEAVLSYVCRDSGGLRKASRRNLKLWQATKKGNIKEIMNIMEPDLEQSSDEIEISDGTNTDQFTDENTLVNSFSKHSGIDMCASTAVPPSISSNLGHVFPWHNHPVAQADPEPEFRKQKTVTMEMRSYSSCSEVSIQSCAATIDTSSSGAEGDTSIQRLSQTENSSGESILMMAIQSKQINSLRYLLTLTKYYPPHFIIGDTKNDGTTLLIAAVQLGHLEIINLLIEFLFQTQDDSAIVNYLIKQDVSGRSVAHYLFNAPSLISRLGRMLPWRQKDQNGQTPLFALCRSYDHKNYKEMIEAALFAATISQGDNLPLHIDDHVDLKGNTLLHIVNDPQVALRILVQCDSDVNATNNKHFTPLMVASKYGRLEMVRILFGDERVDIFARELRGLTAVELAKDDDVRNRIDDLVLFQIPPAADGRVTSVVRSFFVQDATIRLVIKSGAPSSNKSFTVTTCRRSVADFENLANLLALEHPASWLPSISDMRTPFQLICKPSRAVLRDIQIRLDSFLKILLSHTTFATHEMLWEFFLVPDIQADMMEQRSRLKAQARIEKVREEYEPVADVRDVEQFVDHAREMVRSVNYSTKSVARRANVMWVSTADLYDAYHIVSHIFSAIDGFPQTHVTALDAYIKCLAPSSNHPYNTFHSAVLSLHSTIVAMLLSLSRPNSLIATILTSRKMIERSYNSLNRSTRWPLGLLDETRLRLNEEKEERVQKEIKEVEEVGRELRYTWGVVAGELAGWEEDHEKMGRSAVKELVKGMVIREKKVLEGINRALRKLKVSTTPSTRGIPLSSDIHNFNSASKVRGGLEMDIDVAVDF
ncbi:BgTH12-07187 [Blumeria graminis f. sp. triticale]|nr:BgTH12-07187 [Blumeria graminis f. sp. triticale]